MDVKSVVASVRPKMDAAVQHLVEELKTVRTGRANAAMLDQVVVPYYGAMTPLKQMANITVPEPMQLLIQPFDAQAFGDIRLALVNAELGVSMSDDGRVLRLTIPALTQERREEMAKKVGKLAEEARISVRNIRGEVWDKVQSAQKASEISEDNREWARDELDKVTSEYNKKIEELMKAKEEEVRTI